MRGDDPVELGIALDCVVIREGVFHDRDPAVFALILKRVEVFKQFGRGFRLLSSALEGKALGSVGDDEFIDDVALWVCGHSVGLNALSRDWIAVLIIGGQGDLAPAHSVDKVCLVALGNGVGCSSAAASAVDIVGSRDRHTPYAGAAAEAEFDLVVTLGYLGAVDIRLNELHLYSRGAVVCV